jgi:hypothetical protein
MMKSVRMFGAALMFGGLLAADASAQSYSYQTSRYSPPGMLPEYNQGPALEALPPIQQVSTESYMLAARRADTAPEAIAGPTPAPTPMNAPSVIASPSDIQRGPVVQAAPSYGASSPAPLFNGPAVGGSNCNTCNQGLNSGMYAESNVGYGDYGAAGPSCSGSGYGAGGCGAGGGCGWQVYAGAIVMGRDSANKKYTTYETGNNPNQLMYYPDSDWGGGVDVSVTKFFGCDCSSGIQGVYYGFGSNGNNSMAPGGTGLSTPIDVGNVSYGGVAAVNYFDNAARHSVCREDDFQNVEINYIKYLLGNPCTGGGCGCSPYNFAVLTGFRYIRFEDNIGFSSFQQNGTCVSLDSGVTNQLFGWQVGALFTHNCTEKFSWFASPKVGIYGNDTSMYARSYNHAGQVGTFDLSGRAYDLSNDKCDVAMVGSLDLGVNYRIGCHWSLTAGYRMVGITGLALADDQVPAYLAAEGDWKDIKSSGGTIFHGAFFGATFCW